MVHSEHIGNGLFRAHGKHSSAEGIPGAGDALGLLVGDLLDADVLPGEDGAQVDLAAAQADAATSAGGPFNS